MNQESYITPRVFRTSEITKMSVLYGMPLPMLPPSICVNHTQRNPPLYFPRRLKASALAALLHPGLDSARMETKCMTPSINMDVRESGGTESSRKSLRVDGNLGIE